jgi:hypothetical protein
MLSDIEGHKRTNTVWLHLCEVLSQILKDRSCRLPPWFQRYSTCLASAGLEFNSKDHQKKNSFPGAERGRNWELLFSGYRVQFDMIEMSCRQWWWLHSNVYFLSSLFFVFAVLEFELRAYILSHSTSGVMGFFEIGSLNYLPEADFEPCFSWSLPPE